MLVREDLKNILMGKSLEDIDRDLREKYLGKFYKNASKIIKIIDIEKGHSDTSFIIVAEEFNEEGKTINKYYAQFLDNYFVELNAPKWLEYEERIKNENIEEANNRFKKMKKFLKVK